MSVAAAFKELDGLEVLDVRFNINEQAVKEKLRESKPERIQLFV